MSEQIENDKLVPVKDLLNKKFLIPSYQRGYRWTCRQVNDLLDDILEFSKNNVDSYYCLQPLIVKEIKNGKYQDFWEVIDGQQRLTTIHIIFSYLSFKEKLPVCIDLKNFEIRYETREQQGHSSAVFLKEINEKSKPEAENNVDFLHMFYAYNTIEKWCGIYEINVGDLLNNVKFIWYDVNKEEDSHEVFARFNMGKIQLTNAELIKALFLQQKNFGDHAETIRRKQLEIAMEWDTIELALQNDDFWYFLNKKKCETPARIEFIFDLIRDSDKKEVERQKENKYIKSDRFYTFIYFQDKLKEESIGTLWDNVKKIYQTFKEWFEDDKFYQLIGFMLAVKKYTIHDLIELYEKNESKIIFKQNLKEEIRMTLWNNHSDLKFIDELRYFNDKEKGLIKNILLWFNITYTSLQYRGNKIYRFPFGYYNRENISWSLEHIHAQNSEELKSKSEWEQWFKDHYDVLDGLKNEPNLQNEFDREEIKKIILEFLNVYDCKSKKLSGISELKAEQEVADHILNQYSKIKDKVFSLFEDLFFQDLHGIANLALLDNSSNTKLNNSVFKVKRQKIIDIDVEGTHFIPPCTRHVFMKYFTKYPAQFYYWGKNYAEDYLSVIKRTLEASLLTEKGENK